MSDSNKQKYANIVDLLKPTAELQVQAQSLDLPTALTSLARFAENVIALNRQGNPPDAEGKCQINYRVASLSSFKGGLKIKQNIAIDAEPSALPCNVSRFRKES